MRVSRRSRRWQPDQVEQLVNASGVASLRSMPCARRGSVSTDSMLCRGSRLAIGSWKIICIRRRIRRRSSPSSVCTSMPSKLTLPPVGSTNRSIALPKVVLPHPDSPTRPIVEPRVTSRSTPSTALTAPMTLEDDPGPDREMNLEPAHREEDLVGLARRPVLSPPWVPPDSRGHLLVDRQRVVAAQRPAHGLLERRRRLRARVDPIATPG